MTHTRLRWGREAEKLKIQQRPKQTFFKSRGQQIGTRAATAKKDIEAFLLGGWEYITRVRKNTLSWEHQHQTRPLPQFSHVYTRSTVSVRGTQTARVENLCVRLERAIVLRTVLVGMEHNVSSRLSEAKTVSAVGGGVGTRWYSH